MRTDKLFDSPTFTTWLNLTSKSSVLVFLVPLVFKHLESHEIVNWFLILTVLSFISIFDFGLLPNTTRIFSRVIGENRKNNSQEERENKIGNVISSTKKTYKNLTVLVFFGGIIIGFSYLYSRFDQMLNTHKIILILMVFLSGCLAIYNNFYLSLLNGKLMVSLTQRTLALINILVVITSAVTLIISKNFFFTTLVFISNHIISFFVLQNLSKKNLKEELETLERIKKKRLSFKSEVLSSSWKSGVGVFFSLGLINAYSFLVVELFSDQTSAMFMFYVQIVRAISSFSQAPFYSHIPNFNQLYGEGKMNKLMDQIHKKFNLSLLTYFVLFFLATLILPYFVKILNIQQAFLANKLWFWLVISFYTERIYGGLIQTLSISKMIVWHWSNGSTALISLAIVFLFSETKTINLFPISLTLSYLLFGIPVIYMLLKSKMKIYLHKPILIHLVLVLMIILIYDLV